MIKNILGRLCLFGGFGLGLVASLSHALLGHGTPAITGMQIVALLVMACGAYLIFASRP